MQALRRLRVGSLVCVVALGWAAPGLAAEPGPAAVAGPIDEKNACLDQHESAQILSHAGRLHEARGALQACARQSCPEFVRADCVRWLEAINESLPSVVLVARSPRGDEVDVQVWVDGELLTRRLDGKAVELDPGVHQFRFEHPDAVPVVQQLLVVEGEKNRRVLVTLRPQRGQRAARGSVSASVYVLASAAVVALGSCAYFGVSAIRERQSMTRSCAPFCSSAEVDEVRVKLLVADLSLAVALLAGGAALWAGLARGPAAGPDRALRSKALQVDVVPSTGGAGVIVRGAF